MNPENTPFDISLTEEQNQIKNIVRDFAEQRIKPEVLKLDETQEFPYSIVQELSGMGFLGVLIPEKYGGAGLGYTEFVIIIEELAKVDPSIALTVAAHNGLCTNHIYMFGTEEQRMKYLPDLCSGRNIGAWGLTEPGSGSDSAALKSYAVKEGDHYLLNGSKMFTTHGTVGGTYTILAITNKSLGKKGVSAFILEKGFHGLVLGKKENKLGMRASDTTQLTFEDCMIPQQNLLGKEGEGFIQAMKVLEGGRISIAALSCGLAMGALEASIQYSTERKQFNKSLNAFQAIQFKLADMAVNIDAARLMTYKAAFKKDKNELTQNEAAMAK